MTPSDRIGMALLVGCALIAFSITFTFRWTISPTTPIVGAFRLDRWSGEVAFCNLPLGQNAKRADCNP